MKILSIESSCDDSAIALTDSSGALLWQGKISQERAHSVYGGVVPELASRLFARDLPALLGEFKTRFGFECIRAISVTYEPGLSTSLLEGVMMAKALALSLNVPLLAINHLKGHVFSLFINQDSISESACFPLSVLLVSGGHSLILKCASYQNMQIMGSSLDDSFGECYDKAAKMLTLGYPGGAIIDKMACECAKILESRFSNFDVLREFVDITKLPIPLLHDKSMNFSFSGLKNAFRLKLSENEELAKLIVLSNKIQEKIKQDFSMQDSIKNDLDSITQKIKNNPYALALCYNLQMSATEHIIQKCRIYLRQNNLDSIKHFAIVGGASTNSMLRAKMQDLCDEFKKVLLTVKLEFCADNAAMIGRAALAKIRENPRFLKLDSKNILNLDINPRNTEIQNIESFL